MSNVSRIEPEQRQSMKDRLMQLATASNYTQAIDFMKNSEDAILMAMKSGFSYVNLYVDRKELLPYLSELFIREGFTYEYSGETGGEHCDSTYDFVISWEFE